MSVDLTNVYANVANDYDFPAYRAAYQLLYASVSERGPRPYWMPTATMILDSLLPRVCENGTTTINVSDDFRMTIRPNGQLSVERRTPVAFA